MPRPGFVLDVDRSTPPILFHHGEGFRLEKLPPGAVASSTRPSRSSRSTTSTPPSADALLNPLGDSDPLPALLRPGMKLTIAFDDISLPLPPMKRPDIRQRVIEAGARPGRRGRRRRRPPHRRARPAPAHDRGRAAPRRRRPGLRRLRPARPALQPRRRGPRQPRLPRHHRPGRGGRDQQAGRRERPARLRQHQPRVDGRRLEVHRHRPGRATAACATTTTSTPCSTASRSWTATLASCTRRTGAWARCSSDAGVKVFQIETTLNNDMFGERRSDGRAAEARVGVDDRGPRHASWP